MGNDGGCNVDTCNDVSTEMMSPWKEIACNSISLVACYGALASHIAQSSVVPWDHACITQSHNCHFHVHHPMNIAHLPTRWLHLFCLSCRTITCETYSSCNFTTVADGEHIAYYILRIIYMYIYCIYIAYYILSTVADGEHGILRFPPHCLQMCKLSPECDCHISTKSQ